MAAYPDPPLAPVIPVPESIVLRSKPPQVCVECLIGKQKKPILFKVTEPSSIPYRAPPACAKMAEWRFETRGLVHGGAWKDRWRKVP